MAVINPIRSRQGLDIGGIPDTRVDDSIGRGLQRLGGALQDAGQTQHEMQVRFERMKLQNEDFASEQGLKQFTGNFSVKFADMQANMDPKGLGLAKATVEQFDKEAAKFLQTVPAGIRGKYTELLQTARSGFTDKAVVAELDRRDQWFATGVQDRTNELGAQVAQDPNAYQAALSDGTRFIDATGWPDIRKQDEKRKLDATLKLAKAGFYVRNDPDHLLGRDASDGERSGNAVEQVVSRIIGAESGGNADAKNPKSSASGVGQFTNGTWLATIKKHRPDLASGRSDRELLSLKNDHALGREMTTRLTEDSARDLSSAGLPVTPGTLYLAHFAGSGGAKAVLRADGSQSLSSILGPEVMKANGFLNGKTAAWLRDWADKKMDGKGGVYLSPEFDGLSLSDRLSIYDQALAASKARATADQQAANADYKQRSDQIDLGLETGQVTSREQILGAGLRDDDTAKLLRRFDERNKEDNAARATLDALATGADGAKINSFDADQVKDAENAYRYLKQVSTPDNLDDRKAAFVQSSGYIPRDVQADLMRGAASKDVSTFASAMTQADALQHVAPTSFDNFAGGTDVRQKLAMYQGFVNDLGMSGEDAARKVLSLDDPEKKASREVLKTRADKLVKDLGASDISAEFGFWFGNGTGATPGQQNVLTREYQELAREYFYEKGDENAAKALAKADIQKRWGISDISGSPQLMRYPPEKYYPPIQSHPGSPGPTGPTQGLLVSGNIDLAARPVVKNADGTISTVRSMSFEEDGKEVLVPTVSPDGKILTDDQAIDLYHKTGQFLGKFDNADDATSYAKALHDSQAAFYSDRKPSEGPYGYLRDDAMKAAQDFVAENYPDRKVDAVALRPSRNGETRADIAGGRPPRYELVYLYTKNGQQLSDYVWSGLWGVDADKIKALQSADSAARRESFMQENALSSQRDEILRASDAAAERALVETVGPDWMKAQAATAERERGRMAADALRLPSPPAETTPATDIQQQRQQLFDQARDAGPLSPSNVLSGNDPVFGAR